MAIGSTQQQQQQTLTWNIGGHQVHCSIGLEGRNTIATLTPTDNGWGVPTQQILSGLQQWRNTVHEQNLTCRMGEGSDEAIITVLNATPQQLGGSFFDSLPQYLENVIGTGQSQGNTRAMGAAASASSNTGGSSGASNNRGGRDSPKGVTENFQG